MPHYRSLRTGVLLFFACGAIIAQQASPDHSQTKSKDSSPASTVDTDRIPPPVLPLPKAVLQPSDRKPITRVEAETLNVSSSDKLDTYLNTSILAVIRANWYQLVSRSGEKVGGDATIQFTIAQDGSIMGAKLTDGSGHATLSELASKAILKSEPFPPLPATVGSLEVRAKFSYQPEAIDQDGDKAGRTSVPRCKPEDTSKQSVSCVTPPQILLSSIPQEAHPHDSGGAKYSGKAILQLIVTTDGTPSDIKVLKSLGPGLDAKAIRSVQEWKFVPAKKDGKPVATQITVEVEFHLD